MAENQPTRHDDPTMLTMSGSGSGSNGHTLATQDVLPEGTKVGKYTIKRLIGHGGMGVVYEALDTMLQRPVALKVLPQAFTQDEQALRRFIREAQLAARLHHPHVITVFDVGCKGHTYFIAMELVNGKSTGELLDQGVKLDYREATRLVAGACKALSVAHTQGLIHRDVKPANLMFTPDGGIKLGDFGLAKLHQNAKADLTQANAILGTPRFMSPEQCQGTDIDHRSDIYSLGATYFALLAGSAPYDEGSTMQIMFAHCSKPVPDPRDLADTVPEACAKIVAKAMAKDPDDRYPTADAMLADLFKVLRGQTAAVSPAPAPAGTPTPDPEVPMAKEPEAAEDWLAALDASSGDSAVVVSHTPVRRRKKSATPTGLLVVGGCLGVGLVGLIVYLATMLGGDADTETTTPNATPKPDSSGVMIAQADDAQPDAGERESLNKAGQQNQPDDIGGVPRTEVALNADRPTPVRDAVSATRETLPRVSAGFARMLSQAERHHRRSSPGPVDVQADNDDKPVIPDVDTPTPRPSKPSEVDDARPPTPPTPDADSEKAKAEAIIEARREFNRLRFDLRKASRGREPEALKTAADAMREFGEQMQRSPYLELREYGEKTHEALEEYKPDKSGPQRDGDRPPPRRR